MNRIIGLAILATAVGVAAIFVAAQEKEFVGHFHWTPKAASTIDIQPDVAPVVVNHRPSPRTVIIEEQQPETIVIEQRPAPRTVVIHRESVKQPRVQWRGSHETGPTKLASGETTIVHHYDSTKRHVVSFDGTIYEID